MLPSHTQMLACSPFAGTPVVHVGDEVCAGLLPHCFHCARSWKQRSHQFLLNRFNASAGAPRSMKMGTIRSPWRYDAAARHALQSANLRRPAILRAASIAVRPAITDAVGFS